MSITADATASAGQTVTEVDFQASPLGENHWTTYDCWSASFNPQCQGSNPFGSFYTSTATSNLQNGIYDFRVQATDNGGNVGTSPVDSNVVVANGATYVALSNPGSPLSGTVNLTATVQPGGFTPDKVTFQVCPTANDCAAHPGNWQTLPNAAVTPQVDPNSGVATAQYALDTTKLGGDGSYDIGVTADDSTSNPPGDPFQGSAVRDLVIDNTPPNVTLNSPGASLSGFATLSASASDSGTGVDAVKFEVAPAGTSDWKAVGAAGRPPYSATFDTRQFSDGSYDIRAEALDNAGNPAKPSIAAGVTIANPGAQPFGGLTITNYVAPATNIQLLGELPGGEHETWAVGQTNAPPPTIDGTPLPYTAQGDGQVVLLRYTDDTGWQIADVLRNADGHTPFSLAGDSSFQITGQMTASGEAWLVLGASNGFTFTYTVFHRTPGGRFQVDPAATATLSPLIHDSLPTLRLGQTADGTVYGVLVSSSPPSTPPSGPVTVTTQLEYGQLVGGVWTVKGSSLPPNYTAPPGVTDVKLYAADVTGPGTGWGAVGQSGGPMILGRFDQNGWSFVPNVGLDAFDLTGPFAPGTPQSIANNGSMVTPNALRVDNSGGVWVQAGSVIARYDIASGGVADSWCPSAQLPSSGCASAANPPGELPDALFDTSEGLVADALASNSIEVYYHGAWTSFPAQGFSSGPGHSVFVDSTDGWLVGPNSLARVSAAAPASRLAQWPEANRNPLLSVALPPGQSTTDTAGALAVGVNGTALHYDPSAGWQVDPTPPQVHHVELTGVAYSSSSLAFAVGQVGTILRWNGSSWTADPRSVSLTTATLNAVAFGSDGQGWAVGARGTILHYDGTAWSLEQIDGQDAGQNVTSVAVAGHDVYALAGGNLLIRCPDKTWQRVPQPGSSQRACGTSLTMPTPAPPVGSLKLVSGLPDGGLAVAGSSRLIVRQSASSGFAYSPASFNGIPVALAAFRDPSGDLRAFMSVAPPIVTADGLSDNVGGFPAGDGDLLLLGAGGWADLSRDLPASSRYTAFGDGVVQPDPVLAVAASPDGSHAWAVGGNAGTHTASGIGTDLLLSARPAGWFTSSIWRYDAGGSASSPALAQTPVSLPANPNTVSFAFFSSPLCKASCAQVQNAQPDVNLSSAANQIAAFAQQPGGPAFAMLGGNARGSMAGDNSDPLDLARLPQLLSPLSGVPTYAAYGPLDGVSDSPDGALPWAEAFTDSPAPFGPRPAPAWITPQGSGDSTGSVNRYYAFDVHQNGGTLRAIVLDNSSGSLESSAPGQTAWLGTELSQAQSAGVPVVVFAARPLNINDVGAASDGDAVAAQLAAAGVLGVFTTSGGAIGTWQNQQDQVVQVPADAAPGAPQIPEYEGATLTYQQPNNNGVLWYDVSVDTGGQQASQLARARPRGARSARPHDSAQGAPALTVSAIPVISSLALEPLDGLTAPRSSTLSFQGIGRRPPGTIATTPLDPSFPGYNQYVGIPSTTCSGCIGPSYSFQSSDPVVGDFVVPSAPGSPYPKLNAAGKTTHSSTSGLFCAYNSGTTTVTLTAGLLSASLPVTVQAGGYGPPCGTVPGGASANVVTIPGKRTFKPSSNPGLRSPIAQLGATATRTPLPKISVPPPPPAAVKPTPPTVPAPIAPKPTRPVVTRPAPPIAPAPVQVAPLVLTQSPTLGLPPIVPPLIPPALTPVPPGGATVSAQATARREEKKRQHASQSAYVTRPAGASATGWFFPVVGVGTLIALLLTAEALLSGPGPKPAVAELREPVYRRRRR